MSSDVAASDSHYMSPQGMPHQPAWAHPGWGLSGAAREVAQSREFACSTPPLLLPGGKAPANGNMASQAATFGAELDEAAAAITSMMHHRQVRREFGHGELSVPDNVHNEPLGKHCSIGAASDCEMQQQGMDGSRLEPVTVTA